MKPITIQAAGTSKSNKSKPNQTKPINGSMKQDTQPETRNQKQNQKYRIKCNPAEKSFSGC